MDKDSHKFERFLNRNDESRWANPEEIRNASTTKQIRVDDNECQGSGITIISDGRNTLVDNSDTHSLCFGSTGAKKTRLLVMPLINILALAGESFIVSDPKGEIHQKTSGLVTANGFNTIVLNFRELSKSSFWNPLKIPYTLYHKGQVDEAVALFVDFINVLAEPQRRGAKDPYFIELGYTFALAYLLFFIETATEEEANIYNFANFFACNSSPEAAEEISRYMSDGSIAALNLRGVLSNKDSKNTFGNVAACVSAMIAPFIIRKALCQILSTSSFDIRAIGKEKTAIYIIVPDEKTALHFLVTVFIKQVYESLIHEAQQQKDRKLLVRTNIVLDEFLNIPTIPDMSSMISAARSRNIRFFLMAQGMQQLQQKYLEDAETIKGNCDNLIFLTSREPELLNMFSKLCGETRYNSIDGNTITRPLISISELQRLSKEKGEAIILHGRHYPFCTELPDIDEYEFKAYPPIETMASQLPQIVPYDLDKVISEIKNQKRPMPFSVEVSGREEFVGKGNTPRKNIFDW